MANQKVRAMLRWKQIKRFVLKEFFTIVKSKNIWALILNLKNKDKVVVIKRKELEKTCCNFYNKLYKPQEN
jgi:hypothetical protein